MRNHHPFQYQDKWIQLYHWRFPTQVNQDEYLYVMVMYDYDRNTILVKPIKNRQA